MLTLGHHDLIFAHKGNARVAASVTMVGVLAVLIGGAVMAIGPELKQEPRTARNTGPAAPGIVRVIGGAPSAAVPCDQQVWPHLDQRCLVSAESKPNPAATGAATVGSAPATDKVASASAKDDVKLSPLTATPVEHGPTVQNDANSGDGVQEDTAVLRSSETTGEAVRSDVTARGDDELDDVPPPVAKPRKGGHRRNGFHLHFGGFRF